MFRIGFWMLVFGALALGLPHFGYDLRWFEALGEARHPVSIGLVVGGAVLAVLGWRRRKAAREH